jgi:hypothetical protein
VSDATERRAGRSGQGRPHRALTEAGLDRGRLVKRRWTVPRRPTGGKLCGPAGLYQRGPHQRHGGLRLADR